MAKVEKAMQANKDLINDLEAKNQQLHEEKKLKKKREKELEKNAKTEQESWLKIFERFFCRILESELTLISTI